MLNQEVHSYVDILQFPHSRPLADAMRHACTRFKHVLQLCRSEDDMRAEALSDKLPEGQTGSFWREVYSLNPKTNKIAQRGD